MNTARSWITPFMKQCYVTTGVSLNMLSHGLVAGFSAILLPQLRSSDSSIKVDETSESWIASVFCITFITGNFVSSVIMDKLGRKKAHLVSIFIMAMGWYVTVWSSSVTLLIVSRVIQGLSLGISVHLCPVMIGEYTSPHYRGSFLATISLAISCGILTTHTLGSFLKWQTTALICAIIITIDFMMVTVSPETPSWLIKKGRYEECKAAFRWLRGPTEEEELTRMIQENLLVQSHKTKQQKPLLRRFSNKLKYFKITMVKEEFYRPSLIVAHLYILIQSGGAIITSQFTPDILVYVVGDRIDVATMTVVLAVHRFISGIFMTVLIEKFNRRTMIISFGSMTAIFLLAIAGYAYARSRNLLLFDHPSIGVVLIHIHVVSVCSGCTALAFVISGELFPLEYKGVAGSLSATFLSVNMFVTSKTAPYLFSKIGIHVAYCIYGAVTIYCMIIIVTFLPETKGRTLQEIEDGFRKSRPANESGAARPLTDQ